MGFRRKLGGYLGLGAVLSLSWVHAETLKFDRAEDWRTWTAPAGLITFGEEGALQLVKFRKGIDAVKDAPLFFYESKERGLISGGLWEAGSNPAAGELVIDGDPETFWQPDDSDPVEDWAIEIDLGRAVLAQEIRLVFPNREGARPLRQFTVYASTGTRISVQEDLVLLTPVFRTTRPNTDAELVIPLHFVSNDSAFVLDGGLAVDEGRKNAYRVVQRIRIEAEEKTPGVGLAEISVLAVGEQYQYRRGPAGQFCQWAQCGGPPKSF